MHQMKTSEVKETREEMLKDQDYICPLCGQEIKPENSALDHCHKTGKIRGVLHKECNSAEGAMKSKFIRSGVGKYTTFEEYLLLLAEYLVKEHYPLLHPTHAPKPRKLQKRSYNELKREIQKCNEYLSRPIKIPPYPKSRRLTKRLKVLYEQYKIEPKYYA